MQERDWRDCQQFFFFCSFFCAKKRCAAFGSCNGREVALRTEQFPSTSLSYERSTSSTSSTMMMMLSSCVGTVRRGWAHEIRIPLAVLRKEREQARFFRTHLLQTADGPQLFSSKAKEYVVKNLLEPIVDLTLFFVPLSPAEMPLFPAGTPPLALLSTIFP